MINTTNNLQTNQINNFNNLETNITNTANNLQANQDNLQKQINNLNETKADVPTDIKKNLNYIIIVADDMGFSDLGCYGNQYINTPNLDALASQGVRSDKFLSAGVCGISRASWNTGNFPTDTNMELNILGNNVLLPPSDSIDKPLTKDTPPSKCPRTTMLHDQPFVAEYFKEKGYITIGAGKWHLSSIAQLVANGEGGTSVYDAAGRTARADGSTAPITAEEYAFIQSNTPWARGFDYWYGCMGGNCGIYTVDPDFDNNPFGIQNWPQSTEYGLQRPYLDWWTVEPGDINWLSEPPLYPKPGDKSNGFGLPPYDNNWGGLEPVSEEPTNGFDCDKYFLDKTFEAISKSVSNSKKFYANINLIRPHWPLRCRRKDLEAITQEDRDKIIKGYNYLREQTLISQLNQDIVSPNANLETGVGVPPWEDLSLFQQEDFVERAILHKIMVETLDRYVGDFINKLKNLGEDVYNNTLIQFISDNGFAGEFYDQGGIDGFVGGRNTTVEEMGLQPGGLPNSVNIVLNTPRVYTGTGVITGRDYSGNFRGSKYGFQTAGRDMAYLSNTPLKLYKIHHFNGAILGPCIISCPNLINPLNIGKVNNNQIYSIIDIMATAWDILGINKVPSVHPNQSNPYTKDTVPDDTRTVFRKSLLDLLTEPTTNNGIKRTIYNKSFGFTTIIDDGYKFVFDKNIFTVPLSDLQLGPQISGQFLQLARLTQTTEFNLGINATSDQISSFNPGQAQLYKLDDISEVYNIINTPEGQNRAKNMLLKFAEYYKNAPNYQEILNTGLPLNYDSIYNITINFMNTEETINYSLNVEFDFKEETINENGTSIARILSLIKDGPITYTPLNSNTIKLFGIIDPLDGYFHFYTENNSNIVLESADNDKITISNLIFNGLFGLTKQILGNPNATNQRAFTLQGQQGSIYIDSIQVEAHLNGIISI